jgi:hypothetical protein
VNDVIQPSLFDTEYPIKPTRCAVVYEPPTIQDVDHYAHTVCRELAQRTNTSTLDTETTRGFAAFIRAVVAITVHSLNNRSKKAEKE